MLKSLVSDWMLSAPNMSADNCGKMEKIKLFFLISGY